MRKLGLLAIGVTGAVLLGCSSGQPTSVASAVAAAPPRASESAAKPDLYQVTGPLVVEHQVDVGAQREGVVARIVVDAGRRVHKGELLAQLDDRELQAERDAADSDVSGNQANLDNWVAETKVLESDLRRDEELWKAQLITAQQLEHSRYKVEAAKFQITRDDHNVITAKAKLRAAQAELEKTRIVAPFDGIVARRYVREGQKVAVNDRLFWITETEPLRVNFTVPQDFAGKLKLGDVVKVSAVGGDGRQHDAKLTMISPVVDPSSSTLEIRAQLEGKPAELLPGMTVNVQLPRH